MRGSSAGVVILGGGYAGHAAAARLRGRDRDVPITLVDASPRLAQRLRLHQHLAGEELPALRHEEVLPEGIDVVVAKVVGVDLASRRVRLERQGREETLAWDQLVFALGSTHARAPVPGGELVTPLTTPEQLAGVKARLDEGTARRLIVVGGGLTGIEVATELAERRPGIEVTLVCRAPLGGLDLSPGGRDYVRAALTRLGVKLREGVAVERFVEGAAILSGGEVLPMDLGLWTGGLFASPLAQGWGWPVDPLGRVKVEPTLQLPGWPQVFVVGDAACVIGGDGEALGMACAGAMPTGCHAADNIDRLRRGQAPAPFSLRYVMRCISLGRRDAIIQPLGAGGAPRGWFVRGRLAVWIKEAVIDDLVMPALRSAFVAGVARYHWPRAAARRPAALLPLTTE